MSEVEFTASSTGESDRQPSVGKAGRQRSAANRFHRVVASWSRWLHIYASMFGMATIFFFSITGLTLNHPDWFFRETTTQFEGQVNRDWLHLSANPPANWDESDYGHEIAKLEVVEYLRAKHQVRGAVSDFLTFANECEVTFQGPGYAATARVARASGDYSLDVTTNDLISVFNDLHKGRHSGTAWSLVIDISAVLSSFVAVTGFLLIFYLKLRRTAGLIMGLIGLIVIWIMYGIATS